MFVGAQPKKVGVYTKDHFTHEPRAVTMKLWEPERKCPKAVLRYFRNHGVWSWALKCRPCEDYLEADNHMLLRVCIH